MPDDARTVFGTIAEILEQHHDIAEATLIASEIVAALHQRRNTPRAGLSAEVMGEIAFRSMRRAGITSVDEWIDMRHVDTTLAPEYTLPGPLGESPREVTAPVLAERLRHDELEEGWETRHDRLAAYLYGRYVGHSLQEAGELLDRYLTILDQGERPSV